jgi:type I restriction enzyme S subunit
MRKMVLPNSWKMIKLCEVAEYYDGTHQTPEYTENGIPFISVENIDNLKASKKYISTTDFDKYKVKPKKDDLFMTRIGELGLVNIVEDDEPLAYYVTLTLIRPIKILPHFLLHFIHGNDFQRELNRLALLNAVPPKINLGDIGKISVPIPPLPEQRAIAKILTTADKLIAAKELLIAAKLKQKHWLMHNLLTGKIRLSGFCGEWENRKLGYIGEVCMCKRVFNEQTSYEGDVPFYKIGTFGGKADAFIPQKLFDIYSKKYSFPKKGYVLVSAAGTIGRVVIYDGEPAYFQDSNIVWVDNDETIALNIFLFYFYSLGKWEKTEGGSVIRLYNDNIRNTRISLPPLPEQKAIAAVLTTADREIELLKKELEQQKLIKKYLMQQLLTGRIRVKDLGRIRKTESIGKSRRS